MSHDLTELRRAVEEDGADLTSDEAMALFAMLDSARARVIKAEEDLRATREELRARWRAMLLAHRQIDRVRTAAESASAELNIALKET